ncbi:MAG: ATP-binding protein [Salinivirgaceae bacterium]|jgi:MinD superfamily P-loop ATPase|nr:ATP-binding protein [Salinivirgaceae bacterium]
MREITVLSGKGGTGKTTITAALASIAQNTVYCDNDVDAADLHLIFHPKILEEYKFSSGYKAIIDSNICTNCGVCQQLCRFDAIHLSDIGNYEVNSFQCEGCRLCERICEAGAIHSELNLNNYWYVSSTRFGQLVHAKMGPGEENSGRLVSQVRKRAKEIAIETKAQFIINDGPPGIGCAAISSLSGTDLVLLVIEPTKSGLHDAKRLIELINSFDIDACAIINKYDINNQVSVNIEEFLEKNRIKLLAKIPFNKSVVQAMVQDKTIVEYDVNSYISKQLKEVWNYLSGTNKS